MDIFRHRPLFLWCVAYVAAAAGGYLLFGTGTFDLLSRAVFLCVIWGSIALVGGITLLLRAFRKSSGTPCPWSRIVTVLLAFLLVGVGFTQSFVTFGGQQVTALAAYTGERITVCGLVTDRRGTGGYLSSFSVELEEINGAPARGLAVLTCHYLADLDPGERVEMQVQAISLEEAAGDGYTAGALRGDGFVLGLLSETEDEMISQGRDDGRWSIVAGDLRRTLAARLDLLTGADAAGLPSALLLGDRSALSDTVRRDFSRAGVSHLLAISGLHMTLLFGLLDGILRLFRLSKRWRAVLLGTLAFGYLLLLGFPPSATRAVIMLGMVYLSYLFSAESDPLTSLGIAGVLILFIWPYSAADAGFWMSYLSTFALVAIMPWVNARAAEIKQRDPSRPWVAKAKAMLFQCGIGLLVGLIAMSVTLSVVAAVIGEVGILSPVATLLLTPLCGLVLILSLLALPLAYTFLGPLLGQMIAWICTLMTDLAAWMAEPSWSVVSLVHPLVLPIAILMALSLFILLCIRLPARRRWVMMLPLAAGWMLIGGVLAVSDWTDGDLPKVSYVQPSAQSELLVLTEGGKAMICDLSNGSLSALSVGANEASRRGATEISVLMLTHYHRRTVGTLGDLFAREKVRELWVPRPTTADEYYFLEAYFEKAREAGVSVVVYDTGETLHVFGSSTLTLQKTDLSRSVQPVLLLTLDTEPLPDRGGELVVCSAAVFESSLAETATRAVSRADAVIFASHGPLVQAPFGADLAFRSDAWIVLAEKGSVVEQFRPTHFSQDAHLWLGQWRFSWT